jgi:hypothetical protein
MARRKLELSEIIGRKGLSVAKERMEAAVQRQLDKAIECDVAAQSHRDAARQIAADYAAAVETATKAFGESAATTPTITEPAPETVSVETAENAIA